MKLIAFSRPRWFSSNDTHTRWNPDVIPANYLWPAKCGSFLTRLIRKRIFGKSPIGVYLRLNQQLWNKLPASFTALGPVRLYGNFLHALARRGAREQAFATHFLRNRPQLDLIKRLVEQRAHGEALRLAV